MGIGRERSQDGFDAADQPVAADDAFAKIIVLLLAGQGAVVDQIGGF